MSGPEAAGAGLASFITPSLLRLFIAAPLICPTSLSVATSPRESNDTRFLFPLLFFSERERKRVRDRERECPNSYTTKAQCPHKLSVYCIIMFSLPQPYTGLLSSIPLSPNQSNYRSCTRNVQLQYLWLQTQVKSMLLRKSVKEKHVILTSAPTSRNCTHELK